jgi:hypothetical protein
VYAGGDFHDIGGQTRNCIAALDATTGAATTWDPDADGNVYALAVSGGTVYAGGYFLGIGGLARNRIAALDVTTGAATTWDPNASWPVYALTVGGSTVYVGGDFQSIGGQTRSCIAALDAVTATATAWDPNASGTVRALALSGTTVYAAGEFLAIGGQPQSGIAAMGDNTTGTLLVRFDAEVGNDGVLLRWQFGAPFHSVSIERAERESGPWTTPALERRDDGEVCAALDRSAEPGHTYWYRLNAVMDDGSKLVFGPIQAELLGGILASGLTRLSPNPTSGATRIEYAVSQQEKVRLSVLDVAGRVMEVLVEGSLPPGRYSARWDGRRGRTSLAPGLYFLRWESPGRMMTERIVMIR